MAAFLIRAGPPLFYVAHHADDFSLHIELFQMDALPDRVFMREPGARKNVIDVDHHRSALVVLRSDEAAPLESDSHGLLETRFDQIKHRLGDFVGIGRPPPDSDSDGSPRRLEHRAEDKPDG